jgi:hypothetical protein
MLEMCDYKLIKADDITWLMESNGHIVPIPQTMKLIPLDVLEGLLGGPTGIDEETFKALLATIEGQSSAQSASASPN